jgi:hypothetical protein
MQLAVCMSWPPYSYLLGGKLMAALALSKTVADEYQLKYKRKLPRGTKLQGLITISAGGKHCPIFHRIMLRPGGRNCGIHYSLFLREEHGKGASFGGNLKSAQG